MKFNEFSESVREKLQSKCVMGETVKICTVLKNNSKKLTGVIIKKNDTDLCPTIYLEDYFEEYCDGSSMESIVDEILRLSGQTHDIPYFSLEKFDNWDYMKDHIMYKLINTERNTEFLTQVPNREFLDLSVVYFFRIDNSAGAYATTVIHNEHMKMWDATEDDLYECAIRNTERMMPGKIKCMNDVIYDILRNDLSEDEDFKGISEDIKNGRCIDMYVATNSDNMYGAGVMLDEELLKNFAGLHGNFYILPSSIHEVILVPDDSGCEPDELINMVRNVNETEVDAVDVLSDDIYYYDINSGKHLRLIKQSCTM